MKNLILSLAILSISLCYTTGYAQEELNEDLTTDIKNPPVKKDGEHLVNVDENGVILNGYDVVAFYTKDKAVKGNPSYNSTYEGAIYHFSSATNKKLFDLNPEKYKPQFGGFCAVAVSLGKLSPIQLWTHQVVDGRLVFNHNKKARALWNKNPEGNLKKADKKWPKVSQKTHY